MRASGALLSEMTCGSGKWLDADMLKREEHESKTVDIDTELQFTTSEWRPRCELFKDYFPAGKERRSGSRPLTQYIESSVFCQHEGVVAD